MADNGVGPRAGAPSGLTQRRRRAAFGGSADGYAVLWLSAGRVSRPVPGAWLCMAEPASGVDAPFRLPSPTLRTILGKPYLEAHVRYTLASSDPVSRRIVADVTPSHTGAMGTCDHLTVLIDGKEWSVEVLRVGPPTLVLLAGKPYEIVPSGADTYRCVGRESAIRALRSTQQSIAPPVADPRFLLAPMPGRVVKVCCQRGERVSRGTPLVVLEAMKMENELCAPFNATVRELHVSDGQSVERGARLLELDETNSGLDAS